jgi:hypothetical protein
MRNKDTIMLEEAYKNIVSEMAGYRPLMPYFSKIPSVTKTTNITKNEQESEERKVAAGLKINENLGLLEKDPNNIAAAWDIINILNNFEKIRDEFLVGDEEMSYNDILEKILKLTTTETNDPALIKVEKDPVTFEEKPALTIDEYLFKWDPKIKQKVKIQGRDAEHYYLFRAIFKALPDVEAKIRNRREENKQVPIFYFAKQEDVEYKGELVGYSNPGSGFFANNKGISLGFYDQTVLDKLGYHGYRQSMWNAFLKKMGNDIKLTNGISHVFRTSTAPPEKGYFSNKNVIFSEQNSRIPRRKGEPKYAPAPIPWGQYRPDISGLTLEELKFRIGHYEAEEEFRKLYPEDKYPFLYKLGKLAGNI